MKRRQKLRDPDVDVADHELLSRQPWKLTKIIWLVFTHALLPIAIDRLIEMLPRIVAHLDRTDSHAGDKTRDRFQNRLRRKAAGRRMNC